eukprot:Lithocolla_globosa_v1_NODE_5_length_12010_cov_23.451945.p6 type:complete len:244 gc:universal NODE_5_length_12010_cov_23.451945:10912-11643(+)
MSIVPFRYFFVDNFNHLMGSFHTRPIPTVSISWIILAFICNVLNQVFTLGIDPFGLNVAVSVFIALFFGISAKKMPEFSVDNIVFEEISKLIPNGATMVEFGSGEGTKTLADRYNVYSVEHDAKWVGFVKKSHYIHAPIRPYKTKLPDFPEETGWYDTDIIAKKIPAKYDLLLVDGPLSYIGRAGFYANLKMFNTDCYILVDDCNRAPEFKLLELTAKAVGRPFRVITYANGAKKCGIIEKKK